MNERATREKVWAYVDLRKIFSVFTDLDYVFFEENSKNKGNVEFCGRLQTQLSQTAGFIGSKSYIRNAIRDPECRGGSFGWIVRARGK
jgi:hypothetical protein